MNMTFRWFGENSDSVKLSQIRQIPGMTGLMGFLDYKAAGEVWTEEEIRAYIGQVHEAGLVCEVIESVNVHEDIKMGLPSRDEYIANYITTIRNLAKYGVKVIVYNFMPVFDWLRTDLARLIEEDGSNSLYFDEKDLGTMGPQDNESPRLQTQPWKGNESPRLQRQPWKGNESPRLQTQPWKELVRKTAESCNGFSLPGWEPERLAELETTLKQYEGMTPDMLRKNYQYFLDAIIPVCEEVGIKMACHPDDPAWPIFGLPRIAHSQEDFEKIVALHDSPCNALCLCTGSLGSNPENDIPAVIRHFGEMDRIACLHVRNVKHLGYHHFREASHLSADGDLDMFEIMKAVYDTCPRDVYIRPDHGRMIWDEVGRPGYGLYDRALGATYLNGLWEAIDKMVTADRQAGQD